MPKAESIFKFQLLVQLSLLLGPVLNWNLYYLSNVVYVGLRTLFLKGDFQKIILNIRHVASQFYIVFVFVYPHLSTDTFQRNYIHFKLIPYITLSFTSKLFLNICISVSYFLDEIFLNPIISKSWASDTSQWN